MAGAQFWNLGHLSDRQLLERLQGALRTQRCSLAELVAHLGEVEERRLHLAAAHGSLFSYCVQQLGMSEDEACRRIELARLARRFPALFGELASGGISLSVALLLKPVLSPDNQADLIAAVRGASLRTARERMAALFPSPDVPSRIRKLPERSVSLALPAAAPGADLSMPAIGLARAISADAGIAPTLVTTPGGTTLERAGGGPPLPAPGETGRTKVPARTSSAQQPRFRDEELRAPSKVPSLPEEARTPAEPSGERASWPQYTDRQRSDRPRIEPLSAERYRIVFTADASLKQKLERARDLLRHSHPNGDLAPVVSRALDLLLQQLLQRR
ncbi:MAG TPA: hypothetical protein VJU61_07225, partial [Polyangiaceae bacterium]|nr:hypothetical protein [Polyangiaceae bacterium]